MRRFLTPFALTAALIGAAIPAHAEDLYESLTEAPVLSAEITTDTIEPVFLPSPALPSDASVAVARLDGGRLIPTPYDEVTDWTYLDRRTGVSFTQMHDVDYIRYIPEQAKDDFETDNKIDQIRLTAANEGFHYVLIYGVGPDAGWSSFGGKVLSETGLAVAPDSEAWEAAKAKALLVDSYTGRVLGAVTADEITYNIGQLADRVGEMIEDLSSPKLSEDI